MAFVLCLSGSIFYLVSNHKQSQSSSGRGYSLPFLQGKIQKAVNVNTSSEENACSDAAISRGRLNYLLTQGVKVINTQSGWAQNAYCYGNTYTLEGPTNLLNSLP